MDDQDRGVPPPQVRRGQGSDVLRGVALVEGVGAADFVEMLGASLCLGEDTRPVAVPALRVSSPLEDGFTKTVDLLCRDPFRRQRLDDFESGLDQGVDVVGFRHGLDHEHADSGRGAACLHA